MSEAIYHHGRTPLRVLGLTLEKGQALAVWMMFASSFFVIIEPAPCDLLFVTAFALHLWRGLSITALVWPMVLYLLLYNLGGFLSFLGVADDGKAGMFVITTAYMSASALFLAYLSAKDPVRNMAPVKAGWIVGAFIASVLAITGYFNVAGLGSLLAPIGRAQGLFKDPNVTSTYLIVPALLLIQDFMLGEKGHRILKLAALLTIIAAWFLAFSRGAWISLVGATLLMTGLSFILTPSVRLRSRIIFFAVAGTILGAALLGILLSIPEIRELFLDRFTLIKYYDAGETGRFGNQLNSLHLLIEQPLGFGPLQFRKLFFADPHNVYVNAFASYGWLGGISYFLLVISTIIVGFRSILTQTPWQRYSIAIFCGLFTTILQGVQIDTDHWRHFYWALGLVWGLFAASMLYIPGSAHDRRAS